LCEAIVPFSKGWLDKTLVGYASTMGWLFTTLDGAKATLGERAGSIWKNGRGASTGGEKVYEQS
jgi:hypothetical protein